jgi:hypothetical protein
MLAPTLVRATAAREKCFPENNFNANQTAENIFTATTKHQKISIFP